MSTSTGHLGPTMLRSQDRGRSWKEVAKPPAFPKAEEGQKSHVLGHSFWLTPGHASEPGVWYMGASPQGLFRSEDGGESWESVRGLNEHPEYSQWMGDVPNGTPDGPKLHSVLVDPRDRNHLYVGMSSGGIHESRDRGATWKSLVKGMSVVEGFDPSLLYVHDPHCVRYCPSNPDRLYQQNHCGIYRLDRPSEDWIRIGNNMPKKVGDVGFPLVVHPRNDKVAWVFPMDGSGVWPRTSPDGRPAAYVTKNGGAKWQRQDQGLPSEGCLVDREAPGHVRRRAGSGRSVFRNHQRRGLGQPQRGRQVDLHRAAPAGDLCGGNRRALVRVTIPSPLFSYTNRREVVADGETLAAVLLDLERQFPGLRFRMVDEQEQLRPHMRVFVGPGRTARPVDAAGPGSDGAYRPGTERRLNCACSGCCMYRSS